MDDPTLPPEEHLAALAGLARINRLTGVSRPIYRRLRHYAQVLGGRLRVLDVATGSGDIPIDWGRWARRDGLTLDITAVDISDVALAEASRKAAAAGVDQIRFEKRDVIHSRLPGGFDVVTCSLFIHHLDEPTIARLLVGMHASARHAVVICDLERSRLNLAAVWFASRVVTRSKVVHEDATLSVRGALTRFEFERLAAEALDRPVKTQALPPCRFIATVEGIAETVDEPSLFPAVAQPV